MNGRVLKCYIIKKEGSNSIISMPRKEKKGKILFILKIPPPVTGPTLNNKRLIESDKLKCLYDIRTIEISYMKSFNEMGRWKYSKILNVLNIIKKIIWEILYHRPSFVYFNISPHGISFIRDLIYVSIIKIFSVKILFHLRGKGIAKKAYWKKFFYKYCFRSEHVICLSVALKDDIKDVYNGEIFIVPNGIPDERIPPNNRTGKLKGNDSKLKLLFLSNLIKEKGIYDFLDVLIFLKETNIDFEAQIVGSEYTVKKKDIMSIIIENELDDTTKYIGPVYGKDKFKIFNNSDVLIYPTHEDCFPVVILEGMLTGKCIIATKEGAIPEIIQNGMNGYLVEKKNPEQIVEKIKIINKNKSIISIMGKKARNRYLNNYTFDVFEDNINKVFNSLLEKIND